jgi:hypothetical protein
LTKVLFAVHSKHSSFWLLPDVKSMLNVLLHAMTSTAGAGVLSLFVYTSISMGMALNFNQE